MRILFLNSEYGPALEYFYQHHGDLEGKRYREHKEFLAGEICNIADFYAAHVLASGHTAESVIMNDEYLQGLWAQERGKAFRSFSPPHLARRSLFLRQLISRFPKPYYAAKNLFDRRSRSWQILLAQIEEFRPDILHIMDLHLCSPRFLRQARTYARKVVGQISSPLFLPKEHLKFFDLLISSYPHYVEEFQGMGISSAYLQHAFEKGMVEKVGKRERRYPCVFVGGIGKGSMHQEARDLFEELARVSPIEFWGNIEGLSDSSPIFQKYHGNVWGKDMYEVLAQSKIVVNRHIREIAKNYANNMRLYEATGMGAMLITDKKDNLGDIFDIGKEVETYSSVPELIEKIAYYTTHDEERANIAAAGQRRTLRDHTYGRRAQQLLQIYQSLL